MLKPGSVIAERFAIEAQIGEGGMGVVYRARDRETDATVALKLLASGDAARFLREARVLSELSHPAIVRYLAHGIAETGTPYLAMEWLDGITLAQRLDRGALSVSDSLVVVRRLAEGLATAHARGIVHRDIKPNNVLLPGDDVARTKLLDFGVALAAFGGPRLTRTGHLLGTVGYIAPELMLRADEIGPRADVFSLGCVWFEALAARPVFEGAHPAAVMARALWDDRPALDVVAPHVPEAIVELVSRMLSRTPAKRPADATAVLAALETLARVRSEPAPVALAPPVVGRSEQRVTCVIVAERIADPDQTYVSSELQSLATARTLVEARAGEAVVAASGLLVATMRGDGPAVDQAVAAARCALAIAHAAPDLRIALATGRAATEGGVPLGQAVDRALAQLRAELPAFGVRLDQLTRDLLPARFQIEDGHGGALLTREQLDINPARTVLGRVAPCVGRDRELSLLASTLAQCVEEPVARAILVVAPPGMGKTRLSSEALAAVPNDAMVLAARADAAGAGSSLALLRKLLRAAVNLAEGDGADTVNERLARFAAARPELEERTVQFLGELLGGASAEPCPQLVSARNDPRVLRDWMLRSVLDWIDYECARHPLVLVVDDLHWGDGATVSYLSSALARCRERPLFVLALARPQIDDVFPALWSDADVLRLPLLPLTRRACERLAQAILGDALDNETLARIVERAEGNAFYLEELLRHVAERREGPLPESVVAMASSRLDALPPEGRRVLRAAAIFGESFWASGVDYLVGEQTCADWLPTLMAREIVTDSAPSRFPREAEYRFRHGLLREAAYASLRDSDRETGHRRAAAFLEQVGERDPLVLANHHEKGGDAHAAAPFLTRASEDAVAAGDLRAARAHADRGLRAVTEDELRARLLGSLAYVAGHESRWEELSALVREAMKLLPPGSPRWFLGAATLGYIGALIADTSAIIEVIQSLLPLDHALPRIGPVGFAYQNVVASMFHAGHAELLATFLGRLDSIASSEHPGDPAFDAWYGVSRAYASAATDDARGTLEQSANAVAAATDCGDYVALRTANVMRGYFLADLGDLAGAEASAEAAMRGEPNDAFNVLRDNVFMRIALERGDGARVRALAAQPRREDLPALRGRVVLADAFLREGSIAEAIALLETVLAAPAALPSVRLTALPVLARARRLAGAPEQALGLAEEACAIGVRTGYVRDRSDAIAERVAALTALGRPEAETARAHANERIERLAASLPPERRDAFRALPAHRTVTPE